MSTDDDVPHFCAQMFLPAELEEEVIQTALKENPENIIHSPKMAVPPARSNDPAQDTGPFRLGLFVRKMWANGRTLRVRFVSGGSNYIRHKVKQYANVWSQHANIHFKFVESGAAEIRITFERGGSWSYLGIECLIPDEETKKRLNGQDFLLSDEPTMNFGWFEYNTPDEEFSRTVTHEFGHAIGCIHEHSQPNVDIQWNKPVVYASYANHGWSKEDVDYNILKHYSKVEVQSSVVDTASIMIYSIPEKFTTNGFTAVQYTRLSPTDISFIGQMYPKNTVQPGAEASDLETGVFNTMSNMGHRTIVNFSKPYPSSPVFTVGLNFLDFKSSRNLLTRSSVESLDRKQAVLNLQSGDDNASGASWLSFPSEDKDFQHGTFTTKDARAAPRITFDCKYNLPPKVIVFFSTLDIDESADCRVKTYTSEVTTDGFNLHVETGPNTNLSEAGVSWIAIPANKQGIATGTFSTEDVRPPGTQPPGNQGRVSFSSAFAKPPNIFLALNMLDLRGGTQTCVRLSSCSISKEQMEWRIDGSGDLALHSAAAIYIAIDS